MLVIDSHIHLWRENVPSPPHRQVATASGCGIENMTGLASEFRVG